jgi:hypothetical protein
VYIRIRIYLSIKKGGGASAGECVFLYGYSIHKELYGVKCKGSKVKASFRGKQEALESENVDLG